MEPGAEFQVELCGRAVPARNTEDEVRATQRGKAIDPGSVQRYLEGKFGDDLDAVRSAMEKLTKAPPEPKRSRNVSGTAPLSGRRSRERANARPGDTPRKRRWGCSHMETTWDGVTRYETLTAQAAAMSRSLADAAQANDWPRAIEILGQSRLVNSSRPGDPSLNAPLHLAAHAGAPVEVVEQLLFLGAWRTLRNANGERPVDIARTRGHEHLLSILEPVFKRDVPRDVLMKLQENFHAVIRKRAAGLVRQHALRLPELEPLLEVDEPRMWFAVPGMYGGFDYRLERSGTDPLLISESGSRVAGGSGQRHEITASGSELVEKGFA
jgi:hypothetical protein